jgi:MraZ protein
VGEGAYPAVQRFISQVVNKLDAKGRVSAPAPFRQALAQQRMGGFYCAKSATYPTLNGYGEDLLVDLDQTLKHLNPLSADYAAQATNVYGDAHLLEFDGEGRVRLPDELIAHAGIQDRVLFLGLNRIFEIWNPDTFPSVHAERMAKLRSTLNPGAAA